MRVALVNLTSGGLSGGPRKYLHLMIPRLANHPQISQLDVLSPAAMKFVHSPSVSYWEWPSQDMYYGYRQLKRRLEYLKPDVVFIPTARIVATRFPTVVMVRNMEPLVTPFAGNSFSDVIRNIGRRAATRRSCSQATRVIAVSSFVRDFLVQEWLIPASKIGVVPHGVEPPLTESQTSPPTAFPERLQEPWFFTAGSIRPARGLEDAIDAMEILRDREVPGTLVIAGAISDRSTRRHLRSLTSRILSKSLQDRVVWAGDLPAVKMAWCFSHCTGFLMTSRIEACPNTVLEALNYGAASISTTERPMPDFFGTNALYYEAGDSEQLAAKMQEVLALDSPTRDKRSALSQARASEFTWEDTTALTVDELVSAANSAKLGGGQPHLVRGLRRAP